MANKERSMRALQSLSVAVVITAAIPANAAADGVSAFKTHHHHALFSALMQDGEVRRLAADGCLVGAHEEYARTWRSAFESGPISSTSFCITALSASLQRGELDALLSQYSLPDDAPEASALALATGFLDGFLEPRRYAAYLSAPDHVVQDLTARCLALSGARKDCLIAGAIQGVVERNYSNK